MIRDRASSDLQHRDFCAMRLAIGRYLDRSFLLVLVTLVYGGFVSGVVSAQTKPIKETPAPLSKAELEALTDELSDNRFANRHQATLKIWGSREQLREQVQEASRSTDPEVAGRAKWILRQWRRGASPDLPPRVARLLQQEDDPAAIHELIEYGKLDAAIVGIEESAGLVEYVAIKERVGKALRLRFPFYVQRCIENDSIADLVRLVDLVADAPDLAVCRLRLMQTLGMPFDDSNILPRGAQSLSQFDRFRLHAAVLASLNRYDEAIEVAEKAKDSRLKRRLLALSARWQQLSDESYQAAKDSKPEASLSHWVNVLIASDRCGEQERIDEAVSAITSIEFDADALGTAKWKVLAMHGRFDDALKVVDDTMPEVVTDLAIVASRPAVAFNRLERPIEDLDSNLDSWIEEALASQLANKESTQLTNQTRRLLCVMKLCLAVGRKDAAWEIAHSLSSSPIQMGKRPNVRKLRPDVLRTLWTTAYDNWIFRLAVFDGENSVSLSTQGYVTRVLPDTENTSFNTMMGAILAMKRRIPFDKRFRMVCELLQGEIPEGFDPATDFELLYEKLSRTNPTNQFRQPMPPQLAIRRRTQLNHEIVAFFSRHGKSELANKCLQKLMLQGDTKAMHELALQQATKGNAASANRYFDMIVDRLQKSGRGNGIFRASSSDAVLATKILISQWLIAQRAGDQELADQLEFQIKLSLCSPSSDYLNEVAGELAERKHEELAAPVFASLLPLSGINIDDDSDFYDIARNYATLLRDSEGFNAIRWFDLAVLQTIESPYFRSSAYISLPMYVRRWMLEQAIKSKVHDVASESINRILKLDGLDITFAEDLLPKARKVGMGDLADEAMDRVFDRGLEHCKEFPFDVTTANNVAWVAAVNHRRLDEALELSESTVYFEPDSPIYRDTFAEILFLLDRKEEALQVEEACLLDDPMEWHIHSQVKKYREALSTSSKP